MKTFGWVAAEQMPAPQWDLRQEGWTLCHGQGGHRADCRHVLACDVRRLTPEQRTGLAEADRPAWRLILIGVEEPAERAHLLSIGCAEALSASTTIGELAARAQRVADMFDLLPRWRLLGPLTLDLFHRDVRHGTRWLNLHPREFGVLWRLADNPGEAVSRAQLLTDVWRLAHEPGTNSVEVHVSRLRGKLASVGCERLVETVPQGGYRLGGNAPFMFGRPPAGADRLDRFLRDLDWKGAGHASELPADDTYLRQSATKSPLA
ncbi:winged helix-turn-helix transcriptional regulator [Altererythrobacter lauratis]|uniref:Winged helix-turn-helix domain-containing protein n=1 Tax=Alteraurantiacibacter lauratis TaxID=2054627 RepID=A0ABV7ECQ5_9SPHN